MRDVSVTLYSLPELRNIDRDAYSQALKFTRNKYIETDGTLALQEFIQSADTFARELGLRVDDYMLDLYGPGHVKLTQVTDEEGLNDLIERAKNLLETRKGDDSSLTGIYTDNYIIAPFSELNPTDLDSENFDINGFLSDVMSRAAKNMIDGVHDTLDDVDYMEYYASEDILDLEFFETGEVANL